MSEMPSRLKWDEIPEPPGLDFSMPDNPFRADLSAGDGFDYRPEDDPFKPFTPPASDEASAPAPGAPIYDSDEGWSWHDAGIIAVERASSEGDGVRYGIGAIDLYTNAHTGDLGGSYLEIGTFDKLDQAAAFYHELQGDIHNQRLLPFQLTDFAYEHAAERAAERGEPVPEWRGAGDIEYAAYEDMHSLDTPDFPPDDLDLDALFAADIDVPAESVGSPALKALRDIGIATDGFDPDADPPPFIDPETGTAYWIGVFQPDKEDPSHAVTSILSLGRNPDTGEMEAQLAPCVPGDWDKAYDAAKYLLNVVEHDGIEHAFETAEGMALATDQRDLWEAERGLPLEPGATQDLADFARSEWEIDL
jgi:hypothetical protein